MAPGPDPLGKRALFWLPLDPEAEVGDEAGGPPGQAGPPPNPTARSHPTDRRARPAGKHALFSDATPASEEESATGTVTAADPLPPRGLFVVSCSTCGSVTRLGLLQLLWCQLPIPVWLPRRTFDRWMTCPSCRRRTWASVTLTR